MQAMQIVAINQAKRVLLDLADILFQEVPKPALSTEPSFEAIRCLSGGWSD